MEPLSRRRLLSLAGGGALLLLARDLAGQPVVSRSMQPAERLGILARGSQRLGLISDLNSSYGSSSYVPQVHRGVQLLRELRVDLVLCAGDMVAGQKLGLSASQLDHLWSSFERQVLQPLRNAGEPFAPAIGNHDGSSSKGTSGYLFARDRERASRFWRARRDSLGLQFLEGGGFPFRYSIRQGDVFIVVLDASSAQVSESDWNWLDHQLGSAAARRSRLRLVMGHLPAYGLSRGRDRPGEVLQRPERLRRLIERHGVHLYVSGHQHAWYPARVGDTNLLGLGAMGSGPRPLLSGGQPAVQTLPLLDLASLAPRPPH